ncbi:MAG: hypothetical protein WAO91_00425 [Candidatus Nitrosotenuis sp.]
MRYGDAVDDLIKNEEKEVEAAIKQVADEEMLLLKKFTDVRSGGRDVDDLYRSLENYLIQNYSRDSVKRLADLIKVIAETGHFQREYDDGRKLPFTLTF